MLEMAVAQPLGLTWKRQDFTCKVESITYIRKCPCNALGALPVAPFASL